MATQSSPLRKELTNPDKLGLQYDMLRHDMLLRHQIDGTYSDKELAIFLARCAEAHIYNAANKRIEELEKKLRKAKKV